MNDSTTPRNLHHQEGDGESTQNNALVTIFQARARGDVTSKAFWIEEVSREIVDSMSGDSLYLLAPGEVATNIVRVLGYEKTSEGVYVVHAGEVVASGGAVSELLDLVHRRKGKIIISIQVECDSIFNGKPGGISPSLLYDVGRDNIVILATPEKLAALVGKPLHVDTGDPDMDEELSGYFSVTTGYGRRAIYKAVPGGGKNHAHQRRSAETRRS